MPLAGPTQCLFWHFRDSPKSATFVPIRDRLYNKLLEKFGKNIAYFYLICYILYSLFNNRGEIANYFFMIVIVGSYQIGAYFSLIKRITNKGKERRNICLEYPEGITLMTVKFIILF